MASSNSSFGIAANILDRFFAAERIYLDTPPEARDFSQLATILSPEVRLYQSPDLPYGGEYVGHAGWQAWTKEITSRFDVVELQEPHTLEHGDLVVVLSQLRLRISKSAEEIVSPFCQAFKIDREKGLITEIRPFNWDVRGLTMAFGRAKFGL